LANLYLKITNNNSDYYVIWRTYFELPYTIPMDLTTFVAYLFEKKRSFEGLIACWKNLKENNSSLEGNKNRLEENEYNFLREQSEDNYIINKEIDQRIYSELVFNQLNELSNKYHSSIPKNSEDELNVILGTLNEEFIKFLMAEIIYNVSLLPLESYQNIDRTYDRLIDHLPLNKFSNFRFFLNSSIPEKKSAEWFQKLLFDHHLNFEDIPFFVRKNFIFTTNKLSENAFKSSFSRCVDVPKVVELELTTQNLLGYFNHMINEDFNFAEEFLIHLEDIGLLKDDEKIIKLNDLESALNQNLIEEKYLPLQLFNFIDKDGGTLLPPIYTYYFEIHGVIKFGKYNIIDDIYSKYGDLIFTNIDDIEIVEKGNEIYSFYVDNEGQKIYNKIIIAENGSPVQLQRVSFDIGDEIFKNTIDNPFGNYVGLFPAEFEQNFDEDLPF